MIRAHDLNHVEGRGERSSGRKTQRAVKFAPLSRGLSVSLVVGENLMKPFNDDMVNDGPG